MMPPVASPVSGGDLGNSGGVDRGFIGIELENREGEWADSYTFEYS